VVGASLSTHPIYFFFQAEDGIRDFHVTGVQTCALPIYLKKNFRFTERGNWLNVGGQLIREEDVEALKEDIRQQRIKSWDEIHKRYLELGAAYPMDKANHAWLTLLEANAIREEELPALWPSFLERSAETMQKLADGAHASREKDYRNP